MTTCWLKTVAGWTFYLCTMPRIFVLHEIEQRKRMRFNELKTGLMSENNEEDAIWYNLYLGKDMVKFFFFSWRLITLHYCSGFCHTLTWISHGFTCIPHPDPPSHLPLHLISLGLPSAPGPSTCRMHPTWAGDLFYIPNCVEYFIYTTHHKWENFNKMFWVKNYFLVMVMWLDFGLEMQWVSFVKGLTWQRCRSLSQCTQSSLAGLSLEYWTCWTTSEIRVTPLIRTAFL